MNESNNIDLKEISKLISNEFALQGINPAIRTGEYNDLKELKNYLAGKIIELMDRNYDLFFKALYRIDISEEKLQSLFAVGNKEFIPSALADLIIERQIQKLEFRKKYRSGQL